MRKAMTLSFQSFPTAIPALVFLAVIFVFPRSASARDNASIEPAATPAASCDDPLEHPVCLARGDMAPRFELRDLKRRWHRMSDYVGTVGNDCRRPLIVEFFAMNCVVCKQMTPALVDFAKRYDGRVNVLVIAVTDPSDRDDRKLREYFAAAGAKFPVLTDSKGSEAVRWVEVRDGEVVLPHMFLIDSAGRVSGMAGGKLDSIEAAFPELGTLVKP